MLSQDILFTLCRLNFAYERKEMCRGPLSNAHLYALDDAGLICRKSDGIFVLRAGRQTARSYLLDMHHAAERCQKVNS